MRIKTICMRRNGKSIFLFLCFVFFISAPIYVLASDGWKKVAVTKQNDLWYVDQTIGFSSKGSIVSTRARLKFVPGKESAIGQNVKKGLLNDGADAERFHYFIESVEVDCKKNLFAVSDIDFFDAEDTRFFGQAFAPPKYYPATPGSAYEIVARGLCRNSPNPLTALKNTLKTKKPFLYFYP